LHHLLKDLIKKKDLLIQIVLDIYQFDLTPNHLNYKIQILLQANCRIKCVTFSKEEYEIEIEMIKCVKKNTDQHCAKTFNSFN
jgi:hypothetical protein